MSRNRKTMDGNTAAAHVAYAFTEVAAIYPITPSSVMAELVDEWSANGRKNLFGQRVRVAEMQSEGGAAGAVHGSITAGALTTTFTASQGLLLMIPNMYKIAGSLFPGVIHVSARALATHALSIFGDHSDVMACRGTGYAMLASTNPQEVMDLGAVSHLASLKGSVPFVHFFDGFRTSHEMQKIEVWDNDALAQMLDMDTVETFRARALNPEHPVLRGSAQNPDIFFQGRETVNRFYTALPDIVQGCMDQVNQTAGTDYKLFNYYGAPDAETVLVAMGSVCDAAEEVIDYLTAQGEKVGLVKVRLYRPFAVGSFLDAIPQTAKSIVVLDRTKEPGAIGEPLYQDVFSAIAASPFAGISVCGGRYGLGSKDTTPGGILSAIRNGQAERPVNSFTLNINDDVTGLSLPIPEEPDVSPAGTVSCKFWGLGSDGTVGANKNSIKIIGDYTDLNVQAYFQYDSKKSGGVTISHLRFGKTPIKSTYYVTKADFVACHSPSYIEKYDIVQDVKPGGTFLLNCAWDLAELSQHLPPAAKRYLANNKIKFYTCDAIHKARELGLGGRTNMILQAAFFKLANIIPLDDAVRYMKEAITKTYGRKGQSVVSMNEAAVDAGLTIIKEIPVPADWATAPDVADGAVIETDRADLKAYVQTVMNPANAMRGDAIPVSAFSNDGTLPQGTAAFEKRGIAVDVPNWIPENCIQCNQCAYVCPHAVIRPFVLNAAEKAAAPASLKTMQMTGKGCEEYAFSITISPLDCTGCGSCANVCPAKQKALVMEPLDQHQDRAAEFLYCLNSLSEKPLPFAPESVKGSQFKRPLFEFSGACAGCGETPYIRLMTQLFGDRMFVANATGCTSIFSGSAPSTPYTVNKAGHGPTWENSLFEDAAEFGYGMDLAVQQRREKAADLANELLSLQDTPQELKDAAAAWLEGMNQTESSRVSAAALTAQLEAALKTLKKNAPSASVLNSLYAHRDLFVKKSMWVYGGDGWAFDIGYGGLDHVLASGKDVNLFVFNTEVYSNTGGQASKASQTGQVAQFAAAGKETKQKDLAQMAMSYGYVYVAQIAMGASQQQTIKAITEAEAYPGPSLIIAYAPCINHGMKVGMGKAMAEMKSAVEAGYWHLFRFDPRLNQAGKNPFQLDSKAPSGNFRDFLLNEVRYSSLQLTFPDRAEALYSKAEADAKEKYDKLLRLSRLYEKE